MEVKQDKWAEPSSDGQSIQCLACLGKQGSRTNGLVRSRWPFSNNNWITHIDGVGHKANVDFKEAAALLDPDKPHKKYKKQSLTNFFKVVKKTKNADSVVEIDRAVAVVDLSREKQPAQ